VDGDDTAEDFAELGLVADGREGTVAEGRGTWRSARGLVALRAGMRAICAALEGQGDGIGNDFPCPRPCDGEMSTDVCDLAEDAPVGDSGSRISTSSFSPETLGVVAVGVATAGGFDNLSCTVLTD
jgi:hypothetical protein